MSLLRLSRWFRAQQRQASALQLIRAGSWAYTDWFHGNTNIYKLGANNTISHLTFSKWPRMSEKSTSLIMSINVRSFSFNVSPWGLPYGSDLIVFLMFFLWLFYGGTPRSSQPGLGASLSSAPQRHHGECCGECLREELLLATRAATHGAGGGAKRIRKAHEFSCWKYRLIGSHRD